jgi:hypothetical protein
MVAAQILKFSPETTATDAVLTPGDPRDAITTTATETTTATIGIITMTTIEM